MEDSDPAFSPAIRVLMMSGDFSYDIGSHIWNNNDLDQKTKIFNRVFQETEPNIELYNSETTIRNWNERRAALSI